MVLIVLIFTIKDSHYSTYGLILAAASGALASGVGYTIWYMALRGLSSTHSAVVQLSVPIIAAFGGVIFASEDVTFRLAMSASLILGGVLLIIVGRNYVKLAKKTT